jgi:hypothetical protein
METVNHPQMAVVYGSGFLGLVLVSLITIHTTTHTYSVVRAAGAWSMQPLRPWYFTNDRSEVAGGVVLSLNIVGSLGTSSQIAGRKRTISMSENGEPQNQLLNSSINLIESSPLKLQFGDIAHVQSHPSHIVDCIQYPIRNPRKSLSALESSSGSIYLTHKNLKSNSKIYQNLPFNITNLPKPPLGRLTASRRFSSRSRSTFSWRIFRRRFSKISGLSCWIISG